MTFWTLWWSSFKLTSNKRFCLWTLSLFILTLTNSFLPGQFIELTDHPYKSCNTFSNVCCQYFALFVAISDANPFSYFNSFDFLVMELPTLKKSSISLTVQLSGTKVKYFNWFVLSENLPFLLTCPSVYQVLYLFGNSKLYLPSFQWNHFPSQEQQQPYPLLQHKLANVPFSITHFISIADKLQRRTTKSCNTHIYFLLLFLVLILKVWINVRILRFSRFRQTNPTIRTKLFPRYLTISISHWITDSTKSTCKQDQKITCTSKLTLSSHREVFCKIAVLNCTKTIEKYLWRSLLKLKSLTGIFHIFSPHTQLDILQNNYFAEHLFLQNTFSG